MSYAFALLTTLAIEVPLVMALAGRRAWPTALAVNLTSHPLLWLAMLEAGVGLVGGELGVFAFEWLGLWFVGGVPAPRAGLAALLANAASLAVGLAIG